MRPLLGLVHALSQEGARTVVVGGLAVLLHGHPRLTADLDLVIDLERENVLTVLRALGDEGLVPRLPVPAEQFADPDIRERWRRERNLTVFSLHDPANPLREVDLFAASPIPFEQLWARSHIVYVEEVAVRIAGLEDLITMKRAAGRPQDLADVAALKELEDNGGDERTP